MSTNLPTNMVFLRPDHPGIPVDYIRSIEKAGLVTLPQKYLAMYTLGVGPQGPPGIDQNSLFDTVVASCSDEFSSINVDLVNAKTTFRAPYSLDLTNGYIRASLTTAPTGGDFLINVKINDPANPGNPSVSIFTTLLRIDAGQKTSVTSAIPAVIDPNKYLIPDDTEFTVYVTQVGSGLTGTGLKVAVTGVKVE